MQSTFDIKLSEENDLLNMDACVLDLIKLISAYHIPLCYLDDMFAGVKEDIECALLITPESVSQELIPLR